MRRAQRRPWLFGGTDFTPRARPLPVLAAQRPVPARRPHLAPITQPLKVQAAQRLESAGGSHLAPIAQPLLVRATQRPVPARRPHLAPITRPRQVRTAQRRLEPAVFEALFYAMLDVARSSAPGKRLRLPFQSPAKALQYRTNLSN